MAVAGGGDRGEGALVDPGIGRRSALALSLLLDLFFLLASPILLLGLVVASRGFSRPKLTRGLLRKLGFSLPRAVSPGGIWIHAVSVGEVLTSLPLVRSLQASRAGLPIHISVSTYTGLDVAQKHLPGATIFYAPIDFSPVLRRFFRRLRPRALILMELELWPNLLLVARGLGVPVLVANGRITARSAGRYGKLGPLARALFRLPASYAAQNEVYRGRLLALGVPPARIEVLGNLKHDREPAPCASEGPRTREQLGWQGAGTFVWVASCTHPGEEELVLRVWRRLRSSCPGLRLVLAPRHIERLSPEEVRGWGAGELARWSRLASATSSGVETPSPDILLVDTLGELDRFYSLADVVFVGGSLVPRGGHNVLEPARLGRAVLLGPHHENFRDEADVLLADRAALLVADEGVLQESVAGLLADADSRLRLGRAAEEVCGRLKGATRRHMRWLEERLRL